MDWNHQQLVLRQNRDVAIVIFNKKPAGYFLKQIQLFAGDYA